MIMGDPKRKDREPTFRALGKFINRLGGTYITGEDVGTTLRDMEYIRMETEYVVTLPTYLGGAGDIAPMTAFGTIRAMEACCRRVYGSDSIEGKRVAVQGLGAVGHNIVGQLHERGAVLVFTDIDQDKVDAMVAKYDTDRLEVGNVSHERGKEKVSRIYQNMERVFEIADRDKIPTYLAAQGRRAQGHYPSSQHR
ncbi:MAG: hypothetical protein DRG87_11180 [Deltaproteobacteria bacterium]|nr:MAG: hypothetical protein DRG87_11180 [Deltaproteobacteria bacterium]